jgi:hypothetical protein
MNILFNPNYTGLNKIGNESSNLIYKLTSLYKDKNTYTKLKKFLKDNNENNFIISIIFNIVENNNFNYITIILDQ